MSPRHRLIPQRSVPAHFEWVCVEKRWMIDIALRIGRLPIGRRSMTEYPALLPQPSRRCPISQRNIGSSYPGCFLHCIDIQPCSHHNVCSPNAADLHHQSTDRVPPHQVLQRINQPRWTGSYLPNRVPQPPLSKLRPPAIGGDFH